MRTHVRAVAWSCLLPMLVAACGDESPTSAGITCDLPTAFLAEGGPGVDGIPALSNPAMVAADDSGAAYLRPDDRVIGLLIDGDPVAVPLNIGWWHEVVNLDLGTRGVVVTHCPLTGSSLVFDRGGAGAVEFGVSGLLFMNNLVMFDRADSASLWPQMARDARCGPRLGAALPMLTALEVRWDRWVAMHPDTRVVSDRTGFGRNYRLYPYGNYAEPDNRSVSFPGPPVDARRLPKERVLGIPASDGGIAFPFGRLDALGPVGVVQTTIAGEAVVVLWDGAGQGAAAFHPWAGTQAVTLEAVGGAIVDTETGSIWRVDGLATTGPLAGTRLPAVAEAYVAFWFAWAAFEPEATLWPGR